MTERPDPRKLIKKLAAEQKEIVGTTILSPVARGSNIRVKIQGLVTEYKLDDPSFSGWGLFNIVSEKLVSKVQDASAKQRKEYLELFPSLDVILLDMEDDRWWAVTAHTSDTRFEIKHPIPIELVERGGTFETVSARFDGSSFWFESINRKRNPKVANDLRKALDTDVFPGDLRVAQTVPQEKLAYQIMFFQKHPDLLEAAMAELTRSNQVMASDQETESASASQDESGLDQARNQTRPTFVWNYELYAGYDDKPKHRIRRALEHAGATLESFWFGDDDAVAVRYSVDGNTHVSVVRRKDLSVVSAGICLSGLDRQFDLSSLVSVMREFHNG